MCQHYWSKRKDLFVLCFPSLWYLLAQSQTAGVWTLDLCTCVANLTFLFLNFLTVKEYTTLSALWEEKDTAGNVLANIHSMWAVVASVHLTCVQNQVTSSAESLCLSKRENCLVPGGNIACEPWAEEVDYHVLWLQIDSPKRDC